MATTNEMTCKELVELVTDYLDNMLRPSDQIRFEQHLKGCRGCRVYLEQMRQLVAALGKLTEESIPEPARQKLLEAFRDWKRTQRP